MRRVTWLALVFCLWLSAAKAEAVVLRYNLQPNSSVQYKEMSASRLKMTFMVSGANSTPQTITSELTEDAVFQEKVLDATSDGIVSLVRVQESGKASFKMTSQGQSQTVDLPASKTIIKMTNRGQIINARTSIIQSDIKEGTPAFYASQMQSMGLEMPMLDAIFSHPPLPEEDVKPGDTWRSEVRLPGPMGGESINISINSRLISLDTFKGRDCAKIRTFFSVPTNMDLPDISKIAPMPAGQDVSGAMQMTGKVTSTMMWQFDYKNGQAVYGEGPVEMTSNISFTVSSPKGTVGSGMASMAMKANQKIWLAE